MSQRSTSGATATASSAASSASTPSRGQKRTHSTTKLPGSGSRSSSTAFAPILSPPIPPVPLTSSSQACFEIVAKYETARTTATRSTPPTASPTSSPSYTSSDTILLIRPTVLRASPARTQKQVASIVEWMNQLLGGLPNSPGKDGSARILREDELLYVQVSGSRKLAVAAAIVKPIQTAWRIERRMRTPSISISSRIDSPVPTARQRSSSPALRISTPSSSILSRTSSLTMTQPLDSEDDEDMMLNDPFYEGEMKSSSLQLPQRISPPSLSSLLNWQSSIVVSQDQSPPSGEEEEKKSDESSTKRRKLSASAAAFASLRSPTSSVLPLTLPPTLLSPLPSFTAAVSSSPRTNSSLANLKSPRAASLLPQSLMNKLPPPSPSATTIFASSSFRPLLPAAIGIEKIVVASKYRRQGRAACLLHSIRHHTKIWNRVVAVEELAFSEPLEDGCKLAEQICKAPNFLTY